MPLLAIEFVETYPKRSPKQASMQAIMQREEHLRQFREGTIPVGTTVYLDNGGTLKFLSRS